MSGEKIKLSPFLWLHEHDSKSDTAQAVVSLAIIMWFKNNGGGNVFVTVVAPAISFVVQLWLVYTLVANLETLGGTNGFAHSLPYVAAAILIVGLIWGFALKSMNPTAYANIGHMVNDEG